MDKLKQNLKYLKEGISEEISSLKKLSGKKLDTFVGIFNFPPEIDLYYNDYNMVIIDPELNELIIGYVGQKSLILSVDIPEHNAHIWVYQYFNDQLFENYLG